MTSREDIKDLFARYAAVVGRFLPAKGRQDIEREIEATLADRLDDRMPAGTTAGIDDAVALLKEMGHPHKTASSYLTHGYLISPAFYPLFLLVCRIALPVLAAALIGALTLSVALGADASVGVLGAALRILGTTVTAVLQAFALLVVIFALLDRADAGRGAATGLDPWAKWDPRQLPRIASVELIKTSDQVAAIIANTVYIVFLAFLPRLIGAGVRSGGLVIVPLTLSPGLTRMLPFLMAVSGVEILVAILLLARPVHSTMVAGAQVLVKAFVVITAGLVLATWPFFSAAGETVPGVDLGIRIAQQVVRVVCWLGIVFGSIDVAATLIRFRRANADKSA
jgi:hypothetical protein